MQQSDALIPKKIVVYHVTRIVSPCRHDGIMEFLHSPKIYVYSQYGNQTIRETKRKVAGQKFVQVHCVMFGYVGSVGRFMLSLLGGLKPLLNE